MRAEQWEMFKKVAKSHRAERVPLALIMDSPWMPGYLGINHLDYYFDPEVWFKSNLRILKDFPEVMVFPSWWVEYGMAIEPSALGCRIHFAPGQPPSQLPGLFRLDDVDQLQPVDPRQVVRLDKTVPLPADAFRVSVRLVDAEGQNRGFLGNVILKKGF